MKEFNRTKKGRKQLKAMRTHNRKALNEVLSENIRLPWTKYNNMPYALVALPVMDQFRYPKMHRAYMHKSIYIPMLKYYPGADTDGDVMFFGCTCPTNVKMYIKQAMKEVF